MQNELVTIFSQIPTYIFWKDLDLVFRGGNHYFADVAGLKSETDIIGKTDYDLPWTQSQTELYREADQQVIKTLSTLERIEPQQQASGRTVNVYVRKSPLYNEQNQLVGIIGSYVESTFPRNEIALPQKQQTCLEYLVKGLTAKQIGRKMGLSVRTVEYYINIIKTKFSCKNKSELISKAALAISTG